MDFGDYTHKSGVKLIPHRHSANANKSPKKGKRTHLTNIQINKVKNGVKLKKFNQLRAANYNSLQPPKSALEFGEGIVFDHLFGIVAFSLEFEDFEIFEHGAGL